MGDLRKGCNRWVLGALPSHLPAAPWGMALSLLRTTQLLSTSSLARRALRC